MLRIWITSALTLIALLTSSPVTRGEQQSGESTAQAERRSAARAAATEKRRNWIYEQLTKHVKDAGELQQWHERLAHMSDAEVDRAAAVLLEELGRDQGSRGQALLEAARQDQARHEAQRREQVASQAALVEAFRERQYRTSDPYNSVPIAALFAPAFHASVAWVPGITWLPTGASLTTSAAILPGGRVRVSAYPFFSSLGPLHTFPFGFGPSGFGGYPGYGYPTWGYTPGYSPYHYPYYGQHIHIEHFLNHGHHHHHHGHGHRGGVHNQGRNRIWYDGLRTRRGPR